MEKGGFDFKSEEKNEERMGRRNSNIHIRYMWLMERNQTWLYRWCWGFCCQRTGKNKWPTKKKKLWSISGEDHVGLNILYFLNNISIVMLIWKWPLSQTILDGYSLNELLKSNDKNHILDVDEEGAISVKKTIYFS